MTGVQYDFPKVRLAGRPGGCSIGARTQLHMADPNPLRNMVHVHVVLLTYTIRMACLQCLCSNGLQP